MLVISPSTWSIVSTILRASGALLTLPIALRVIPEAEVGFYYTFLSVSALAILLDMGFAQTLIRFSSQAWSGAHEFKSGGVPSAINSDPPNLALLTSLVGTARYWYLFVSILITLVLSVPGGYFILGEIDAGGLDSDLMYCWLAMAFVVGISFVSEFWRTVLFGIGGMAEAQKISIISQLSSIAVTAIALLNGLGLWSFPIGKTVLAFFNWSLARSYISERLDSRLVSWKADTQLIATMWPMAWRQGLVTIGEFLTLRAGVIVCAALFGLEKTARYGLSVQLVGIIAAICIAPLAVSTPLLTKYRVHRNSTLLIKLFVSRTYIGLLFIVALGILASFLTPPILDMLGATTSILGSELFLALLFVQLLNSHQNAWVTLVLTENKNPFVFPIIFSGLLTTLLSWLLGTAYGIWGMIMGQLIVPLIFTNWWITLRGYKGLNASMSDLIKIVFQKW